MFESAVNKLTLWYVAALLLVVLLFSLPIYNIATNRLERSAERQGEIIAGGRTGGPREVIVLPPDFASQRREVLNDEREELLKQIIFIDIVIVGLGAVASYFFAKRTLRPIEEAHTAQSRFTADASHELRTPLATMQTEIEVALKSNVSTKKTFSETLNSNLEEIARLKNLSDQLLVLTKIDNDKLTKKTVLLSKAIDKRATELEKQHGIKITKEIQPKIKVLGEEDLLTEVVTILVNNSLQHANVDNPKVRIALVKDRSKVVLSVEDNGEGIAEKDLPYIFDRFYRGTKTKSEGHGLGLSLAYEIISKHGGQLTVENKPSSGGAMFIAKLPFAK